MSKLEELQQMVLSLTYGEMMIFAQWFADTDKEEETINDVSFWAFVINEWANNAEFEDGA